eukprot:598715-Pelagomonas_calceolata.AAC.2
MNVGQPSGSLNPGTYKFNLTIVNNAGESDSMEVAVEVSYPNSPSPLPPLPLSFKEDYIADSKLLSVHGSTVFTTFPCQCRAVGDGFFQNS